MANQNKYRDSDPMPADVRRFYDVLINNGTNATSESNPQLFSALNGIGNRNLPDAPYVVGKYWAGFVRNVAPTETSPSLMVISAIALGEVAKEVSVNTGREMSTPIGMIELNSADLVDGGDDPDSSYFTIFANGDVVLEGKQDGLGNPTHKDFLNDAVGGLPGTVKLQNDEGTFYPQLLTDLQRGALLSALEDSVQLGRESQE